MYSITSFVDGLRKAWPKMWSRCAAALPIFGQAMIDELARHGYRLSAGTLYPVLHGMERQG
jgi:hypothetical protein